MTSCTPPPEPEPRYERFRLVYPSRMVVESFYAGGITLEEARVTHVLAIVEPIEGSQISAEAERP